MSETLKVTLALAAAIAGFGVTGTIDYHEAQRTAHETPAEWRERMERYVNQHARIRTSADDVPGLELIEHVRFAELVVAGGEGPCQ